MIKPGRTSTTGLTCDDAINPDDPDDTRTTRMISTREINDHQLGRRSDAVDLRKGRNPDGSDDQLGHLVRMEIRGGRTTP
jgi:hypothetical protein